MSQTCFPLEMVGVVYHFGSHSKTACFSIPGSKCLKSSRQTFWEIIRFSFHAVFAILSKTFLLVLLSGKYYAGNYSQIKHSLKRMHD